MLPQRPRSVHDESNNPSLSIPPDADRCDDPANCPFHGRDTFTAEDELAMLAQYELRKAHALAVAIDLALNPKPAA
jgi:hypothetical protein